MLCVWDSCHTSDASMWGLEKQVRINYVSKWRRLGMIVCAIQIDACAAM